jgi:leucyl aminopeptidase
MHPVFVDRGGSAIPIWFVTHAGWPKLRGSLDTAAQNYAAAVQFEPKPGRHLILPAEATGIGGVLFGLAEPGERADDPFLPGKLADLLPAGTYRFANAPTDPRLAALAIALGCYRFTRYRKPDDKGIRLQIPDGVDGADLSRSVEAVELARDLINTPANDMGPAELEQAVVNLAARHGASTRTVVGEDLLKQNFPLVHAVGRATDREPRLIDLQWGNPAHPKVTLVGKGVCFDTGGLDIKPDAGMLNMKKDMGGAASVLALAHMLMDRGCKIRLRVLVPAVENAISGNAFRPRDIYRSRKGISVEIGNTDAEGRLILADAITLADEEQPDLLIDMATLTGAARVALGPDLPPFYTDDDGIAAELHRHAMAENDPVWRMPLWPPYDKLLDSKIADTNNVSTGGFAGSITAALFLRKFVEQARAWIHVDIFAWVPSAKPGRPEGGECQAARALYAMLVAKYG